MAVRMAMKPTIPEKDLIARKIVTAYLPCHIASWGPVELGGLIDILTTHWLISVSCFKRAIWHCITDGEFELIDGYISIVGPRKPRNCDSVLAGEITGRDIIYCRLPMGHRGEHKGICSNNKDLIWNSIP